MSLGLQGRIFRLPANVSTLLEVGRTHLAQWIAANRFVCTKNTHPISPSASCIWAAPFSRFDLIRTLRFLENYHFPCLDALRAFITSGYLEHFLAMHIRLWVVDANLSLLVSGLSRMKCRPKNRRFLTDRIPRYMPRNTLAMGA